MGFLPSKCLWSNVAREENFQDFIYFHFMCMSRLPARMSAHHACAVQRGQKMLAFPGTAVVDGCELLCGCENLNLGSL